MQNPANTYTLTVEIKDLPKSAVNPYEKRQKRFGSVSDSNPFGGDEQLSVAQEKSEQMSSYSRARLDSLEHLEFYSGNPCVEITSGVLHLYRLGSTQPTINFGTIPAPLLPMQRSQLVCILAVPSYLPPSDFLDFIGPFKTSVSHVRILRDESPNKYMVLARFTSQSEADSFYQNYNGREFSSLDPETCIVVFVSHVEFLPSSAGPNLPPLPPTLVPLLNSSSQASSSCSQLVVTTTAQTPEIDDSEASGVQLDVPTAPASFGSPVLAPTSAPPSAFSAEDALENTCMPPLNNVLHSSVVELPTCPVCLERLDASISGIMTILCNHSFHCDCIFKWGDPTCPVCRYSQHPEDVSTCSVCDATENLWICLICGLVGCGRYSGGHAYEHFQQTQHTYAMEIETQRVWDYAGDGYVHRLIQNKADGKLVEFPDPKGADPETSQIMEAQFNSKLEAIGMEYNHLLTHQLESQRVYFEARIAQMEAEHSEKLQKLSKDGKTLSEYEHKINSLEKEKKSNDKKLVSMQQKLDKAVEENSVLLELNKTLMANQEGWRAKIDETTKTLSSQITAKDKQIQDLQEQVRDLMFFLETQQKISERADKEEIQGGQLVIEKRPSGGSSSSTKKKPSGRR